MQSPPARDDHEVIDDFPRCPYCGSPDTYRRRSGRRIAGIIFLSLLALSIHPLVFFITFIAGVCFVYTTRAHVCSRQETRGFDVIVKRHAP